MTGLCGLLLRRGCMFRVFPESVFLSRRVTDKDMAHPVSTADRGKGIFPVHV